MSFSRRFLAMAIAMATSAMVNVKQMAVDYQPRSRGRARERTFGKTYSSNKFKPHQSKRECARRVRQGVRFGNVGGYSQAVRHAE